MWTATGACDRSLSPASGGTGGATSGMTGASSGGATGKQGGTGGGSGGIMDGAGASGHQGVRPDGGPGGIGGATGGGIGGYCGTGCFPTYGPLVDAGQLPPCGPTGPVPGQRACESACGSYRAVRWRDFADTYACYYDRAGNLVSGRVMGTCSDPATFQSGPDVMCPGGDGGGAASFDAASGQ